MRGSLSCENDFSHANSSSVAAASGGGGTRKSLPDEITQVFQLPALGSTGWLKDCANAAGAHARITKPKIRVAIANMSRPSFGPQKAAQIALPSIRVCPNRCFANDWRGFLDSPISLV